MLALPPSKLVVHPAYPETLKQYLDISNQLQGTPPGNDFQIQSLKASVSTGAFCHSLMPQRQHAPVVVIPV